MRTNSRALSALAGFAVGVFLTGCAEVKPSKKTSVIEPEVKATDEKTATTSDVTTTVDTTTLPVSGPSATPTPPPSPDEQLKVSAYEQTVYPLVKQYCSAGECHASSVSPQMAGSDVQAAYQAIIAGKKIDFKEVAKSRLFLRLQADNHNCWKECQADSVEMKAKLVDFKKRLAEANLLPADAIYKATGPLGFVDGVAGPGEPLDGNYIQYAKNGTALTAPMVQGTGDSDSGPVLEFLSSPTAAAGSVTYTFNVTMAGTYSIWARTKTNAAAQRLNVAVDTGAAQVWQVENSTNNWVWDRASLTVQAPPPAAAVPGIEIVVATPGPHTLIISGNTANVKFNRVALTTLKANYEGGEVVGPVKVLKFNLADVCGGKAATLIAEVREWDAPSKTILIRNLRIETTQSLVIKKVMPLINGNYDERHASFNVIDTTVQPPGALISRAPLVAVGEGGFATDKLSWTFEKCE